jgi:hypothetical protein
VRVVEGAFANFTGTIEEVKPEKQKVRVLVSIFGRGTPVELDYAQVEKPFDVNAELSPTSRTTRSPRVSTQSKDSAVARLRPRLGTMSLLESSWIPSRNGSAFSEKISR